MKVNCAGLVSKWCRRILIEHCSSGPRSSRSSRGVFNSSQGLEDRRIRSALRVAAKVAQTSLRPLQPKSGWALQGAALAACSTDARARQRFSESHFASHEPIGRGVECRKSRTQSAPPRIVVAIVADDEAKNLVAASGRSTRSSQSSDVAVNGGHEAFEHNVRELSKVPDAAADAEEGTDGWALRKASVFGTGACAW